MNKKRIYLKPRKEYKYRVIITHPISGERKYIDVVGDYDLHLVKDAFHRYYVEVYNQNKELVNGW